MTNKSPSKPTPYSKLKRQDGRRAPIEFVAPYSLEDCYHLLRETRDLIPGSAGFLPELAQVNTDTVEFYLRRMRYNSRYRKWSSSVAIKGSLHRRDAASTMVIGVIKIPMSTQLLMGLIGLGWLAVVYMAFWVSTKMMMLTIGLGIALLIWGVMIYMDRWALIRRLKQQLAPRKAK